ncbi:D-2-hydroxyacid dehydrogenase family protein [Paracoccus hibiscisoli]|uniref:D-2-hydroxyacid dehydrogenase family protein n=1 Tax=Paracoccus hibiscisoli TaxID=2023261 RepID=UPI0023F051E3|nr:D-2-hydroxyacid dehydrogenase family protein [Paracoccus hibiscisoli]
MISTVAPLKIAILDDYADVAVNMADWSDLGDITVFRDTLKDESALIQRLHPFEVLCLMRERTPLPGRIIRALPNLRLIVTSGLRNLSIDLAAAAERGIPVSGTEMRKTMTAELTMGLTLALERRIVVEATSLTASGWQIGLGRDLHGLTLGLVGLGKVGQQMATLGRAFGMRVAAWSQNLTAETCAAHDVNYCDSLHGLLAQSDVVSVHLVLSDRSRGLIDSAALSAMRPTATLINTSRAAIVDTVELLTCLRQGRIAGAALDVFEREPVAADDPILDNELIKSGRLLLTPHLGYASQQTFKMFYAQMAEAVAAWKARSPIRLLS